MNKEELMHEAINLSQKKMRAGAGGPIGALIVKNGEIISRGWNKVTSTNDPTAHAEIVAIRSACKQLKTFDLSSCEIYTSCMPCPMCLTAIYWARIKKFYYANTAEDADRTGFDDKALYKEIRSSEQNRSMKSEQLLHKEALEVFKEWDEKEDKMLY